MVERIISNNDQEKTQSHSLVLAFNVTQRAALVCLCRNLFWQTILAKRKLPLIACEFDFIKIVKYLRSIYDFRNCTSAV